MNHERVLQFLGLFLLIHDGFAKTSSPKKPSISSASRPGIKCVDGNPSQTYPCSTEKASPQVRMIIGIVIACCAELPFRRDCFGR
ncbi:hypothetical protein M413DRAFT_441718 [Hebeloma cylindrosporum]|uniref:Secreted protein n=1 Tax=Hebeloma cylindrosporum TaxID=76867 RepID=A0A0C3CLR3_HEBCY|nr:hypothetical protein M413DRAFT_441718 [Hebeloma cylindrosporum h7]